jgi:hypothetical protein
LPAYSEAASTAAAQPPPPQRLTRPGVDCLSRAHKHTHCMITTWYLAEAGRVHPWFHLTVCV